LIIVKIGGSLIRGPEDFQRIQTRLNDVRPHGVIISALYGMTNLLESMVLATYQGKQEEKRKHFGEFAQRHLDLCSQLKIPTEKVQLLLDELESSLNNRIKVLIGPEYDFILSFGEKLSSQILTLVMGDYELRDAREFIVTDDNFSNASILDSETKKRFQLGQKDFEKPFITQGFIASTVDGLPTTLGREGSDYSATLFAKYLDASEVIIFKDVGGVYCHDPRILKNASIVEKLSFQEVQALTDSGCKVLYQKVLDPIIEGKINLSIRSINDVGSSTLIVPESIDRTFPIAFVFNNDTVTFIGDNLSKFKENISNQLMVIEEGNSFIKTVRPAVEDDLASYIFSTYLNDRDTQK
jgi:aspartate kinase